MTTTIRNPSVKLVHGQAITTSIKISEAFSKRHDAVLRAIANLECSEEFRLRNFVEASYEVKQPNGGTASYKMYTITRDGFAFLASGFTGKEAARWKEKYIAAFNALEKSALDKIAAKRLPKPVAAKVLPAGRYHYPRSLLNQAYFSGKNGSATLDLAMLTNAKFISPLLSLLNQLRTDGHEVTAPLDEALAMRTSLMQTEQAINEISHLTIKARMMSAER